MFGIADAKQTQRANSHRRANMHRACVIADQQPGGPDERRKLGNREIREAIDLGSISARFLKTISEPCPLFA